MVTTQLRCKSGRTRGRKLILNAAPRKVGELLLSLLLRFSYFFNNTVSLTASKLAEASQTALLPRTGPGHQQLSTQSQAREVKLDCLTDNGELYRTSAFYQEEKPLYLAFQKQFILSSKQDGKKADMSAFCGPSR